MGGGGGEGGQTGGEKGSVCERARGRKGGEP